MSDKEVQYINYRKPSNATTTKITILTSLAGKYHQAEEKFESRCWGRSFGAPATPAEVGEYKKRG